MARQKISGKFMDSRSIAVYARKSKVTETGKSIEVQKEKCIALAYARFGATREEILVYEDEGKSGFYADRPAYRRMLNDIEQNKIRVVICYKIDRISRRTVDLLNLVQQMDQKGIAFVSVSDKELDTTSRTGKIMISLLSAISEFERDIIAERITENMYELAKEGRWLGGTCPLGYCSKKERQMANGHKTSINHLAPVEKELATVRLMFETFLRTASLSATAEELNQRQLKSKNNKSFTNKSVKNILTNPVYAVADSDMRSYFAANDITLWADDAAFDGLHGMIAYNKTEQTKELGDSSRVLDPRYTQRTVRRDMKEWVIAIGKHKGIIRGADWIRAQRIISDNSKNLSARPKASTKSLLSGFIRCINCGGKMFVRGESGRTNPDGSRRFHYVCDVKYRNKGNCKHSPNHKGYELDCFVVREICKMSTNNALFFKELNNAQNALSAKARENEKALTFAKKRVSQIDSDIQNQIMNLRTAPERIKKALYQDITALNAEQGALQAQISQIYQQQESSSSPIEDFDKVRQTILDFPKLLPFASHEEKLHLLQSILECVIVKDDAVHIFFRGADGEFPKG